MSIHFSPPPPDIEPIEPPVDLDAATGIAIVSLVSIAFVAGLAVGLTVRLAHFWMFAS